MLITLQWKKPPITGPVSIQVVFYMPIPKSLSKRILEGQWHTKKPDLDNLIKQLDCLNGLLIKDDSQICSISSEKKYSKNPRIELTFYQEMV